MSTLKERAEKLLDDWDVKHFGRCPIANGSFQYKTRVDLIDMISAFTRREVLPLEEALVEIATVCPDAKSMNLVASKGLIASGFLQESTTAQRETGARNEK